MSLMVTVPEGRAITVRARLSPLEPESRWGALPAVSGVGAGVSLAVGALVGLAALRKNGDDLGGVRDSYDPNSPTAADDRDRAHELDDEIRNLNTIADVSYAAAAVLGSVTVLLLATSRGEETGPSTATVADGVGPSIARVEGP